MNIDAQMDLAFKFLQETSVNIFLTGKAGTGKTTFLKHLKEVSPKRMIVMAPTGVASINAGGMTIHSFFQLPFGPYLPSGTEQAGGGLTNRFSKEKINIIKSLDLLVIDEVSMVRADLLDAVSDALCRYRNNSSPFGGVQLLLIGDLRQLAPVAKDDEWILLKEHYPSTYFFDSKALSRSDYLCIELTTVYRQSDSSFINLLNNIRNNNLDNDTLDLLNRRYRPDCSSPDLEGYITLTTHNYQAQRLNSARLSALTGPTCFFKASVEGDFPEYSYPTDFKLELKKDAQVMFVKNDTSGQHRYYNGKIGKIVFIDEHQIIVADESGNEVTVEKESWNNVKYTIDPDTKEITETISGSFTQYPLKTAWAITIHKSQGLTFDRAIIDAASAFSFGQVYVALSRCKSLEGLILSSVLSRDAVVSDKRVEDFASSKFSSSPGEERLITERKRYYTKLLVELFDFSRLQKRLQYASYAVGVHLRKTYPALNIRYADARDASRSEIEEVGRRFQQQLTSMVEASENYRTDCRIEERVRKGVVYFLEKIDTYCSPLADISNIVIDNKESRKVLKKAIDGMLEDVIIKKATLSACGKGFSISGYLSAKAKASIDQPISSVQKKKGEKAKADKNTYATAKTVVSLDILHPELFEALRKWRSDEANARALPVYVILQQQALIGIANTLPTNPTELIAIPKIGKKTVELYGDTLLELVANFKPDIKN